LVGPVAESPGKCGHDGAVTEPEVPSANGVAPLHAEWARYSGALRTLVLLNSLVALVLELAMFAFVFWWGLALDLPLWARIPIAVAAFGVLAVLWGAFASPKARLPLPTAGTVAFKAVAFGAGALSLWSVGFPEAAVVFAVLAAASTAAVTYVRTRPAV
jgi:hypothetical protein